MSEQMGQDSPQILRAEDLLARMRAGTKEVHEIKMREMVIPVRVLSLDELQQVRREAIRLTSTSGGDETEKHVITQKCTLKLASTMKGNPAPLLSDSLLKLLSLDEVQFLYDEYIRVCDSVNPAMETMSPDKFRELVDALKKNTVSSRDCSLLLLRAICSAFVELIQRLEAQTSPPAS